MAISLESNFLNANHFGRHNSEHTDKKTKSNHFQDNLKNRKKTKSNRIERKSDE